MGFFYAYELLIFEIIPYCKHFSLKLQNPCISDETIELTVVCYPLVHVFAVNVLM